MAKRARRQRNMLGFVVLLILGVGLVLWATGSFSATPTPEDKTEIPTEITTCDAQVTPQPIIYAYDADNPNTASTEATNSYRKVGDKGVWTTWTQGTQIGQVLSIGSEYEFVVGISPTDEEDNAYGEFFTWKIPCEEAPTMRVPVYNDEIETSLSATFYNEDNNAAAQTFTAGQEKHVYAKLVTGSDEYFGNPTLDNPNIIVLKLNSTEWDAPNSVKVGGVELARVATPLRYDGQAAGFVEYAYELPAISDENMLVDLYLDADDTTAPTIDGTMYIYAGGYYFDKNADLKIGVEDEDGNVVGATAADTLTLDFT